MGKLLLKLFVLFLIGTVLYSTVGCGSSQKRYKQNIVKVIKLDHEFSEPLKTDVPNASNLSVNEKYDQRAQQIFTYVQNAKKSLNYDNLPSDFVSAYMSHLNAWVQYGEEIANHPDLNLWSNAADAIVHTLLGDFFIRLKNPIRLTNLFQDLIKNKVRFPRHGEMLKLSLQNMASM